MSNITFLTTRRKLSPETVDLDIREIIERRFLGRIKVNLTRFIKKPKNKKDVWAQWECEADVHDKENSWRYGFDFYLEGHHLLHGKHPHSHWGYWALACVVLNELGVKYNGLRSDETDPSDRWKPEPEKYPTFQAYNRICYGQRPMAKIEWDYLPESLKKLDRELSRNLKNGH